MRAWMVVTAAIVGISLAMGLGDLLREPIKCPPGSHPASVGPSTTPTFCQGDEPS